MTHRRTPSRCRPGSRIRANPPGFPMSCSPAMIPTSRGAEFRPKARYQNGAAMTTAETAWTEAMRYENRHDPYRFFDELRKTPVVQVADKVYVVTGYRELLQLAHDPHVSSDIVEESHLGPAGGRCAARRRCRAHAGLRPGAEPDRVRPGQARQAAPTGDAALRAAALPERHPQHGSRHPDAVQ